MIGIWSGAGVCDPNPLEVYPSGDAASPGFCEANSVGSWTYTANNSIATNADAYDGSYSLAITNTVGGVSTRREFDFVGEVGAVYDIEIWAKKISGANMGFVAWLNFTSFTNTYVSSTSWTKFNWTLVAATGTQKIRAYPSSDGGTAVLGDEIRIDNISIIKRSDVWWQDNAASTADVNSLGTHYTLHQAPTYTVDATDYHDGAYSLKQVCNNESLSQSVKYDIPVINGETYTVNFWYKAIVDAGAVREPRLYQGTNCTLTTSPQNLTATTWTEVTTTLTATATGNAIIEFMTAPAAGDSGNTLWLDGMTITRN
jgi:hypothetical protein